MSTTGTPILVPLTPSLYVPGKLASTDTVLVDIGTGFYVEKVRSSSMDPPVQVVFGEKGEEYGADLDG